MKKLFLIILSLFSIHLIASEDNELDYYKSGLYLLKNTLPDSLLTIFDDKTIIVYMKGYHAHIWSAIIKEENNYKILCGRIYNGKNELYEPIESNIIDTAAFLHDNRKIISWGLDSLLSQNKHLKTIESETDFGYINYPGYLGIFYKDTLLTFNKNEKVYMGSDSINFNRKVNRLSEIMYWLAEPYIRPYTPDSIYIKNH